MCSTTGEDCSKAETWFTTINDAFKKDDLNWDNVVSVGLDNTTTNMGIRNSLKTRILSENAQTFIAGCNCHLAHLAAGKGGDAYAAITKFDCEDHQVDLYYFFKRSTHRKGILKEYMDFVGCEWENFTRFVSTRWLSLETCCDKEFKKFEALKSMFISRVEKEGQLDIDDGSEGKIYQM